MYKTARKALSVLLSVCLVCSVFALGTAPAYAESNNSSYPGFWGVTAEINTPGTANSVTIDRSSDTRTTLPISVSGSTTSACNYDQAYVVHGSMQTPAGTYSMSNNGSTYACGNYNVYGSASATYNAPIPAIGSSATYTFTCSASLGSYLGDYCSTTATRYVTIYSTCYHSNGYTAQGTLRSAADCEHPATYWYACVTCGENSETLYFESGDANGHAFIYTPNNDGTHAVTCANCDYSASADCDYEETAHPATCTRGAYTTYRCKDCGYTYDGPEGAPNGHAFIYTPNNDGTHTVTCANCDYSASADCDYEETAHPATCQVGAYTTYKCRNCGYTYDGEQGATVGHSFTDYHYNDDATCSADGTETAACDFGCGETATRTAAGTATGVHAWKWVVDTEPTCGEAGVKHQKCENCDATQNENTAIEPTGAHSFGEWGVTKDATCTAAGEQTRTCAVCGKTEKKAVKKLDHVWGEWTDDEGSTVTCTSGGTQHRTCENCGETESRTVEGGVGHVIEHPNLRGEGYCKYCGAFRCDRCAEDEQYEQLEIIGVFFRIVHFFIHLAHMISYDNSVIVY